MRGAVPLPQVPWLPCRKTSTGWLLLNVVGRWRTAQISVVRPGRVVGWTGGVKRYSAAVVGKGPGGVASGAVPREAIEAAPSGSCRAERPLSQLTSGPALPRALGTGSGTTGEAAAPVAAA